MHQAIHIQDDIARMQQAGVLDVLLADHSTGANIVWASAAYEHLGAGFAPHDEIRPEQVTHIRTRAEKHAGEQAALTKAHAEVFTPTWVCKRMIDDADAAWWEAQSVEPPCDTAGEASGTTNAKQTNKQTNKQAYLHSKRLEITCGEAPYLANRYDAATGEPIPLAQRTGILDRKLRLATELAISHEEWLAHAEAALKATYGYEYQGDNLLIARANLLCTALEFAQAAGHTLTTHTIETFAYIISWNIFQMDGLSLCVPFGQAPRTPAPGETPMLPIFAELEEPEPLNPRGRARIFDWTANTPRDFADLRQKGCPMKFDYIIGNPPYQEETEGENNQAKPLYHLFMDATYSLGDAVELITPARFLSNQGATPIAWNKKMLADPHLKIISFFPKSQEVFANADIKGGVVITYRDERRVFECIDTFIPFEELASIYEKVRAKSQVESSNIGDWVFSPDSYRFSDYLFEENPSLVGRTDKSHAKAVASSVFNRYPEIFFDAKPDDGEVYVQLYGRIGNERTYKFLKKAYLAEHPNLEKWKVIVPGANGSGAIGEVLTTPLIGQPLIGHTQTFISIGTLESEDEANALLKYIKTRFTRALLGIMKTTQNNQSKSTWSKIPLQDFTSASDIDWSKSVADVDAQLYKKYGLTQDEIDFIETHVKEMV